MKKEITWWLTLSLEQKFDQVIPWLKVKVKMLLKSILIMCLIKFCQVTKLPYLCNLIYYLKDIISK
jgi:hypothetical protein